jgi:S-adenosyl-L-methionine hydrolase (adenosine-forming)
MIALFTDFGVQGPYLGQLQAVLRRGSPDVPIVELMSDVPAYRVQGAAYLLAALIDVFAKETIFLGVVDPGVGGNRGGVVLQADGQYFVGPDNGLFSVVAQRAEQAQWWQIDWKPQHLSASFHGRDWFAPVATRLALGEPIPGQRIQRDSAPCAAWPVELAEIIYIDNFGNGMTGLRASSLSSSDQLQIGSQLLNYARTFCEGPMGAAFWYHNALGLVEIAVNQARADQLVGFAVGDVVTAIRPV